MKKPLLTKYYWPLPLLFWLLSFGFVGAADQPNILVYLSDDHSQFDSSLYGNSNIPAPEFERLASDGITFTHAFVASPSCAPSRAALLTGLMPARNGAEANHTYPKPGTHSLIQDLQSAGYEVAAFGKVAHGGPKQVKRYGFDHIGKGKRIEQVRGEVELFLSQRKSNKPLCLFVGTSNPHVSWTSPSTFDPTKVEFPPHHIDTPSTREHRAAYYQEIKELDAFLGDLRSLAAKELGDNVLFIHTSDHGSQWPFGKWNLYDYGIRVPFIASWQGKIASGTRTDAMISWIDLLPTMIEIGGGQIPEQLDGRPFTKVLLGKKTDHRQRIFTTHTGDGVKNIFPIRSIRTRDWKLIHNLHPEFAHTNHSDLDRKPMAGAYWTEWAELAKTGGRAKAIVERYFERPEWELFHVKDDKWEQQNLIGDPAHADRIAALKQELENWMVSQADQQLVHSEPRLLKDPQRWHPDSFKSSIWKPVDLPMKTQWTSQVTPQNALPEHPQPLFKREDWVSLNGLWNYKIERVDFEAVQGLISVPSMTEGRLPRDWDGQMLVPYAVDSPLSGVMHILRPQERIWYE
ncbi:MAG: sulfatase [Planctomycetota bacterium]